jgi:hypothetical protein
VCLSGVDSSPVFLQSAGGAVFSSLCLSVWCRQFPRLFAVGWRRRLQPLLSACRRVSPKLSKISKFLKRFPIFKDSTPLNTPPSALHQNLSQFCKFSKNMKKIDVFKMSANFKQISIFKLQPKPANRGSNPQSNDDTDRVRFRSGCCAHGLLFEISEPN